ncbi:MAG: F0F1 ATP synthase subunit delta [Eubacteriaceae bacterium]|jgi:F-type H+-transporting ATPase subunit delta
MSLVAKRYAQALFDTAVDKNLVDGMYDEFSSVIDLFKSEAGLMNLMLTPSMNTGEKKGVLERVFGGAINKYLKNFLNILLDKNRFEFVMEIHEMFRQLVLPYKNTVEARVLTVVPLDEELRVKLEEKLADRFQKKVVLENVIDETILGGAVVYVGDQVIDGSIKNQLDQMKTQMNNLRLH